MNKVILTGRLTKDPEVRATQGESSMTIASWSLAVDRRGAKDGQPTADFINCKAFGKLGDHIEKYWHKGMKMFFVGHVMTGSYTNKEGTKVYTTDFVADEIEFAESKGTQNNGNTTDLPTNNNGFSQLPKNDFTPFDIPSDGDLPFAPPTR